MKASSFAPAAGVLLALVLVSPQFLLIPTSQVAVGTYDLGTAYNSERKVVVDPAGNIFTVYSVLAGNGSYYVRVAESSDGGRSWSVPAGLPAGVNSSRSALAVMKDGGIALVWTQGAPATSQIYFSAYQGDHWSPKTQLSNSSYYSGYPAVAADLSGGLHVVWYGFDGTFYQIYYTTFNGTAWSRPYDLSTLREDSLNPSIAIDAQGKIYVVWYAEVSRYFQVFYARFDGTWTKSVPITFASANSENPSVAIQPDGQVNVVWTTAINQIGEVFTVSGRNGAWGQRVQLTNGTVYAENPTQTFADNGTAFIFWTQGGELYGCAYSKACAPHPVYSIGFNSYPSVEWAGPGDSNGILLMWSNLQPGSKGNVVSVMFAKLGASGEGSALSLQVYGAIFTSLIVAAVALMLRELRRGR